MSPLHHDGSDGDHQITALNAYEQEREARIAANRARLVELGIVSTNPSASMATMPLGVLSSSGRPSAWARSAFGATEKATKRRPTVSMKVCGFFFKRKRDKKRNRSTRKKKQFHVGFRKKEKKKKKVTLKKKLDPLSPAKKNNTKKQPFTRAEPTRSSSRIRTLEAEGKSVHPGQTSRLLGQQQQQQGPKRRRRGANVGGAEDRQQLRPDRAAAAVPTTYAAPFSLRSIDVTVLSLGTVHRGAWRHRYWSSSGCLFHHAYPVGFRSVKAGVFGRSWECRVEEGASGPLFVVESAGGGGGEAVGGGREGPRGRRFEGPSPTRPWTAACLAAGTGQRISGPLFFGFSDPATQAAVESLYSPQELEAARRGEGGKRREGGVGGGGEEGGGRGPSSASVSAAAAAAAAATERAALDFVERYGIGEATACVLAHTSALSGKRFASADELEAWARGGGEEEHCEGAAGADAPGGWPPRARRLLGFLLGSEEFPASTRRWPAWRLRAAPRLVASVCGLGGRREAKAGAVEEDAVTAAVAAKTTQQQQQQRRRAAAGVAATAASKAPAARSPRTRATRSSRK